MDTLEQSLSAYREASLHCNQNLRDEAKEQGNLNRRENQLDAC
jgi:hypothetical protein